MFWNKQNANANQANGGSGDAKNGKKEWLHSPDALVNGHVAYLVKVRIDIWISSVFFLTFFLNLIFFCKCSSWAPHRSTRPRALKRSRMPFVGCNSHSRLRSQKAETIKNRKKSKLQSASTVLPFKSLEFQRRCISFRCTTFHTVPTKRVWRSSSGNW